jgi:hypothetical protein
LVKDCLIKIYRVMSEVYATGSDGKKYRTRSDYEAGRFQSMGTNAAQRARINRAVGGKVV